ncbi:hypothetical protein [Tabrizicola soli]|uniref:Uncharacterized protein n=1 Tax=Tabrizicola soli TaxID=2185115 RepID=A0ABV7DXZ8_9RHOB|nr:hypothetical protein [Tabrizicola soli]
MPNVLAVVGGEVNLSDCPINQKGCAGFDLLVMFPAVERRWALPSPKAGDGQSPETD